jgi:hypothetical protein
VELAVRNNGNMTEAVMESRTVLEGLYNDSSWWPAFDRLVQASLQSHTCDCLCTSECPLRRAVGFGLTG